MGWVRIPQRRGVPPWESTKSDKDDRVVARRCWAGENERDRNNR